MRTDCQSCRLSIEALMDDALSSTEKAYIVLENMYDEPLFDEHKAIADAVEYLKGLPCRGAVTKAAT